MSGTTDTMIISRLVTDDGQQVTIEVAQPASADHGADCGFRLDGRPFISPGIDERGSVLKAI